MSNVVELERNVNDPDRGFLWMVWNQLGNALVTQSRTTDITPLKLTAFVSYCYSGYGFTCIAMALILNRTLVIASNNTSRVQQIAANRRRNLSGNAGTLDVLKSASQVCFRVGAIMVLLYNMYNLLVALLVTARLTGRDHVWFYRLIDQIGWFEYDIDTDSKYMRTPKNLVMVGPSTDILWPVFLGFCMLAYMETFISAIVGDKPYTESGLTIFEHSLMFQEASDTGRFFLGDPHIVRKPTEQLLVVCLFLTLTHLNIQIGGLINRNKYRLIPSSIIGILYLWYFTVIFRQGQWGQFPLFTLGNVIPQLIVIAIIGLSLVIFLMAVLATGFNFKDLNYAGFFLKEDPDSQGRLFNLGEDFYTTLMNLGMLSITLAGKSSYITELSIATVDDQTWVERSAWEKFKSNLHGFSKSQYQSHVIEHLREKGYGNIIDQPSMKLVTGDTSKDKTDSYGLNKATIMKRRLVYLQMIVTNTIELLKGLFFKILFRGTSLPDVQYDDLGDEIYEQFEERRQRLPPFLRKFVRPRAKPYQSAKLIELDDLSEEELAGQYVHLLRDKEFSETDNSNDYCVETVEDWESDIESVVDNDEFISPEQFRDLVDDKSSMQILQYHLHNEKVLTRSQFNSLRNKEEERKDEATKIMEILISKRHGYLQKLMAGEAEEEDYNSSLLCVICQTNQREIITWPCKCFSICDSCRLTLATKAIEGCVCCRRDVDGVSKVFIP